MTYLYDYFSNCIKNLRRNILNTAKACMHASFACMYIALLLQTVTNEKGGTKFEDPELIRNH
jgi:hypothetical protein